MAWHGIPGLFVAPMMMIDFPLVSAWLRSSRLVRSWATILLSISLCAVSRFGCGGYKVLCIGIVKYGLHFMFDQVRLGYIRTWNRGINER